ncbi:MAG: sulfite exporter TauE/SafE family protein [Nitrosomonadales bacterium]|nr:sulfite exporter TauE/SafE family protein [Nitrosomonadales bacterium]
MPPETLLLLAAGILVIAVLYSSVGHAGASGYIAVMSLLSLAPDFIKPMALALNVLVAAIATWQFHRAGHFSWRLFWPFAVLAVPFAFLGGYVNLPTRAFKVMIGLVLLFSAVRFVFDAQRSKQISEPPRLPAIGAGAGIGLLSGLTGTGGGIFLTPLLLFMGWAEAKPAAAVSALFILVNSIAGLAGYLSNTHTLPPLIVPLFVVAALGGGIGSYLGSRRFESAVIKRFLAVVLLIAGTKLIFT